MCLAALPALGGKNLVLTAISPALGLMSALGRKKKPTQQQPLVTQGIAGPSPSY